MGSLIPVNWRIRRYKRSDEKRVVVLSLRAWAPVFASLEEVLGVEIFRRLHPDWRVDQDKAAPAVLVDPAMQIWVAETWVEAGPTGFVAAMLNTDTLIGEVYMLAVDPESQDQGVGSALTETATDGLRTSGMRVMTLPRTGAIFGTLRRCGQWNGRHSSSGVTTPLASSRSLAESLMTCGAYASRGTSRSVVSVPGAMLISRGRPSSSNTSTVKV